MIDGSKAPVVASRVVVTGMAGAGKSTFSRRLATRSGLPVIHLDLHSWNPGWERVPPDEFLEKQRLLLAGETWIVDSNDVDDDLLLARADMLVVLATPWWLCAARAFRRGLRRPPETVLPAGCEESLTQRIGDEWGIVWRNLHNRKAVPERDQALVKRCDGVVNAYVLHTKREQDRFVYRFPVAGSR